MRDTEGDTLPPAMREALAWLMRLTSGAATQADAQAFESWRAQDPKHGEAFREAVALRQALRAMPLRADTGNVVPLASRRSGTTRASRRGILAAGAGAIAACGAMLMIDPPYGLWPSLSELGAGERTSVGERRTLTPLAGITIEMNGLTALTVNPAGREATLISGEAFVAIAPEAGPFALQSGDTRWLGKAAQFDMRIGSQETCVTCIEGHLLGEKGNTTHRISAGQRMTASSGGGVHVTAADTRLGASWRRGLLIFRDTPLAVAVEDINRFRHGKIVLASDAVGRRPVSGMFHTAQIENAVSQIQQLLDLRITRLAGGLIVLA